MRELTMDELNWVSGGTNNKQGSSWWDTFTSDVESFASSITSDMSSWSNQMFTGSFDATWHVQASIRVQWDGGRPTSITGQTSGNAAVTYKIPPTMF